jgi:hypothetical protein
MNAKNKALVFLKDKKEENYLSSPQKLSFNTEKDIGKALDIAIKEAKKEMFDDIFKLIERFTIIDAQLQEMRINIRDENYEIYKSLTDALLKNYFRLKEKHLNTKNTDNKKKCNLKGLENIYDDLEEVDSSNNENEKER